MYEPRGNNAAQLQTLIERIAERRAQMIRQRADIDAMLDSLNEVEALCRSTLADRQTEADVSAARARRTG